VAHRLIQCDVVVAAVLLAVGTGCSSTATGSHSAPARAVSTAPMAAGGGIPMGPGPQHPYTVRAQPPAGSCHYRHTSDGQPLPDVSCTPGALNPDVTPTTLATTICRKSGYLRLHRLAARCGVRPSGQPRAGRGPQRPAQPVGRAALPRPRRRSRPEQPQGRRGEPPAHRHLRGEGHAVRRPAGHRHRLDHRRERPGPHPVLTPLPLTIFNRGVGAPCCGTRRAARPPRSPHRELKILLSLIE
jgi:hypothetical protein